MKTSPAKLSAKAARSAKYRAAYKARGLRSDGKPFARRKPCGCRNGCCLLCQQPGDKRYVSPEKLAALRADYETGMTAAAVERKYGLGRKSLKSFFERRGIPWRTYTLRRPIFANGRFQKDPPKTEKEIAALVAAATKIGVPPAIKQEWRHWSMAKRQAFIARLRVKFPSTMPTGKCSPNVTPFKYGDTHVHAIMDRLNAGRNSRTKVVNLKPNSEGLIYQGKIFFWRAGSAGGATGYVGDRYPHLNLLNRLVYEQTHGPIPDKHTVIHRDGNKNNFTAGNLALRSMADCMRANSIHKMPLPQRQARWELAAQSHRHTRLLKARAATQALLNPHDAGLLAAFVKRNEAYENA